MTIAYEVHFAIESSGKTGQDRVELLRINDAIIIILADGAGGIGDGARAADFVVQNIQNAAVGASENHNGLYWQDVLIKLDKNLAADSVGESTAVVINLIGNAVMGASVGDSQAWLVGDDGFECPTDRQIRKPLIGSGSAMPVPFEKLHRGRRLIVGSDGLFNYATVNRILEIVRNSPIADAPAALIDSARLRSGNLQDDISVVAAAPLSDHA